MEIVDFISNVSNIGIPILITLVVIWSVVKLTGCVPSIITNYLKDRKDAQQEQERRYNDLQERYSEQIKIITSVAQQGIETQRRSNEVIEQNNILLKSHRDVMEKLNASVDNYWKLCSMLQNEIGEVK